MKSCFACLCDSINCQRSCACNLSISRHERSEIGTCFQFVKVKIVIQNEKHLILHDVDLMEIKDLRESLPVGVPWTRVIEVLGGDYESSKKNAMPSAFPVRSFCRRSQLCAQAVEVDGSCQESADGHITRFDKM